MAKRRFRNVVILLFGLFVAFFGAWQAEYPDGDPKNLEYTLWKHGLYKLDLDGAADTLIRDAKRNEFVLGRTEEQLRKRFGYLLTPDQASFYLRGCTSDPPFYQSDPPYGPSPWKDKRRLFIRQSPLMVVFEGGKATQLWLIKGC